MVVVVVVLLLGLARRPWRLRQVLLRVETVLLGGLNVAGRDGRGRRAVPRGRARLVTSGIRSACRLYMVVGKKGVWRKM